MRRARHVVAPHAVSWCVWCAAFGQQHHARARIGPLKLTWLVLASLRIILSEGAKHWPAFSIAQRCHCALAAPWLRNNSCFALCRNCCAAASSSFFLCRVSNTHPALSCSACQRIVIHHGFSAYPLTVHNAVLLPVISQSQYCDCVGCTYTHPILFFLLYLVS